MSRLSSLGLVMVIGGVIIVVGLVIASVFYWSRDEPSLVSVSRTATPSKSSGTPTPEELMTGRWFTIISETKFQEIEGVRVTVKQLLFSTPERLLPDMEPSELGSMGIDGAQALVGVRINVDNNTGRRIEFNPLGFDNILRVNNEQATPVLRLSDKSARIPPGEKESLAIMFSLSNTPLEEISELTYSVRGLNFHFTDLIASN